MSFLIANPLQPLIDLANTVLNSLHDMGFVYGTAIVLLTFITRALILPLSVKQIRSMRALSALLLMPRAAPPPSPSILRGAPRTELPRRPP